MTRTDATIRVFLAGWAVILAGSSGTTARSVGGELAVPWGLRTFAPEEGCRMQLSGLGLERLPQNEHYLSGPRPGEAWQAWLGELRRYREAVRTRLGDPGRAEIAIRFDGVRAWVRTDRRWAFAADLVPGETVRLCGEGRWLEGNGTLCLALDWCDRGRGSDGAWLGWSTVVASAPIARDGAWHRFEMSTKVPAFDATTRWARPIVGMDGTFDRRPGAVLVRNLTLSLPHTASREKQFSALARQSERTRTSMGMDDSVYRRADLAWMTRNFVCGFVMVYDRSFWDPERRQYRVGPLCEEAQREFGGFDSVVLWHAYPRIGADARNQFDFFRDMPGGLPGVRDVVREFHRRGVKVFLPYNPWDTGTAREKGSDDQALADLTAAIEADGIFLDTMVAAPQGLRRAVDALRAGVAFEPEGHPAIEELGICSGSWAQWLAEFPEIGVLRLKWLEQRHMQHQVRRWDKSHQRELAAAWLNGSGILVWENIFGAWNPWNAEDRATLRRMAPVLRHFAPLLAEGEWLPYFPTRVEKVYASCWKNKDVRLWTIVNRTGRKIDGPVLEVDDQGQEFFDLWRGERLKPDRVGGKLRLSLSIEAYGAIATVKGRGVLSELLQAQRREANRPAEKATGTSFDGTSSRLAEVSARKRSLAPFPGPFPPAEMLPTKAVSTTFVVRHMRRECGCYPDPSSPPEAWERFLTGTPHEELIEHRVAATLGPYWIDPRPVTNGQFEAFLKATSYAPRCRDRFLHHWGGPSCPPALRDKPVVYVDLDDARAYAAWAGKGLPTEWEWQHAAQQHKERFDHAAVFEWTESQRDDGHTRFVMLRGGSEYQAKGSIWYFPGGSQPIESHAKFLLMDCGLDRCSTIGFRCVAKVGSN